MGTKKKKGAIRRIRRFFSFKKKKQNQDDDLALNSANIQVAAFAWTPEEIFDEFDKNDIPVDMQGSVLLVEIGGIDRGWVLDFTGKIEPNKVSILRYNIPNFQPKKMPRGPPENSNEEHPPHIKEGFRSLPWACYKDRKTFSKIESGQLSDMVAYVTGRIAVSGDDSKWNKIDSFWKEAKERITERRKNLNTHGLNGDLILEEEDDEEEVDEEARIMATFKPEVEPTDIRKREFWMRHIGTDALVATYLFLLSSIGYNLFCFLKLQKLINSTHHSGGGANTHEASQIAHTIAQLTSSLFYTLASAYLVKLSYPETTMLMAYRAMTKDPSSMSFIERYFTANEMLIALWLITAAFAIPLGLVALYELIVLQAPGLALKDSIVILVSLPLVGVLNISAMPDCMRANNGQGSRFFFDYVVIPLLRLKEEGREEALAFWTKHMGNDALAGAWIFAAVGVLGGIAVTPLVIIDPTSVMNWYIFATTIPFSIGSLLFVRASYPETMNSSIFFSEEPDPPGKETEVDRTDSESDLNGELTPLIT